jgi:hypothetical protein
MTREQQQHDLPAEVSDTDTGKRGTMRRTAALLLITACLAIAPTAAYAAKPSANGGGGKGGGGSVSNSSLSLEMVNDANGNGTPNWSDTVTFNVSTTATSSPYVTLKCYQGGTTVLSGSAGFWDGYAFPAEQNMQLSSPSWTGGAADCTATLWSADGKKTATLATLSFHADA